MSKHSIKIVVNFELRDDGGLRAWSPDLPGLRLSHRDASLVLQDVKHAIEVLMTDVIGQPVKAEPLLSLREARAPQEAERITANGPREYVGHPENAATLSPT